ncbi:MAG TPA: hypothetical protein VFQ79_18270 [Bryobacteraceae bacterium]|nr:hypothetical protein [Bryobacteraceae bacterium]
MTVEESIVQAVRALPPNKKEAVLRYAESLQEPNGVEKPVRNLYGLWKDLGPGPSAAEIDEVRHEAWKNFLRDDV